MTTALDNQAGGSSITICTAVSAQGVEKPAGKTLIRQPDGNILKESASVARYNGHTMELPGGVDDLAHILLGLRSSQLIVPGAIRGTSGNSYRLASKNVFQQHGLTVDSPEPTWWDLDGVTTVQWKADYFDPSDLMLIELDIKDDMPLLLRPVDFRQWWSRLEALDPALAKVRHLITWSSSGRVSGAGTPGMHAWVRVKDPADVGRYLLVLHMKLVVGSGGYLHDSGKSQSYYSLVDPTVGASGRKVYAGPPEVRDGIVLKAPEQLLEGFIPVLDTSALHITDEEEAEFKRITGSIMHGRRGASGGYYLQGEDITPEFEFTRGRDGGGALCTVAEFLASGDEKWRINADWRGSCSEAAYISRLSDGRAMIFDNFGPTKHYMQVSAKDVFEPVQMQAGTTPLAACEEVPTTVVQHAGTLILYASSPIVSARKFVQYNYVMDETLVLHFQSGDFYAWAGTHYHCLDDQTVRTKVWNFLEKAKTWCNKRIVPFNPNCNKVNNVIDALKAVVHLDRNYEAPCWLDGRVWPPPVEVLPCANGLLHLPSGLLLALTPEFFGLNSLPFNYDHDADLPARWLSFLHEDLWPNDPESVATLQEIFGLMLTPDTTQQKIFLLVGPKRSGKGTIARVLTELLGRENVAGPTLASLGQNFGLSPLIGKSTAIISDARLSTRADQAVIAERLLTISGEDTITIDRKYKDPWTGRLTVRFNVMSNELPRLGDASGALASRFVPLMLENTFFGREDPELSATLMQELGGILNWAIEGWHRLHDRGYFVIPATSREAIEELEALGSPIGTFVKERCIVAPGQSVSVDSLFREWQSWCSSQGREHPGTKQSFGRDLKAAIPGLHISRPREGATQRRVYEGIALNSPTEKRFEPK